MDKSIDILEADFSNLCHVRSIKKRRYSMNSSKIYLHNQTINKDKIEKDITKNITKNEDLLERPDFLEHLTKPRKRPRSNAFSE
jgi:hypothetical protein